MLYVSDLTLGFHMRILSKDWCQKKQAMNWAQVVRRLFRKRLNFKRTNDGWCFHTWRYWAEQMEMKGSWKPSCCLVKWHFIHPRMCSVMICGFGAMKIPTRWLSMPCRSIVRPLFFIEGTMDGVTYMDMFKRFVIWRVGSRLDTIRFETRSYSTPF